MICGGCEISEAVQSHHWFERDEEGSLLGPFFRYVCQVCNNLLRSPDPDDDHVLPPWSIQKEFLVKRRTGCSFQSFKEFLLDPLNLERFIHAELKYSREEAIFNLIKENPTTSVGEIAVYLGVSGTTVRNHINRLKNRGKIVATKGWILTELGKKLLADYRERLAASDRS